MKAWGLTDVGVVREVNQDTFRMEYNAQSGRGLFLVCDGMGGAKAGEVASGLAADAFLNCMANLWKEQRKPETFKDQLLEAYDQVNEVVYDASRSNEDYAGMGTTMVCALCGENQAIIGNVGDSRAYCIDRDGISQITVDHSLVQMMVTRGELTPEQAKTYPGKNLITRAVGTEPVVMCDIIHTEVTKGDYLLLCSDGLSNMMDDQEILFEVVHGAQKEDCCQRLLNIAKNRGAPDNVTSVLIMI